MDLVPDFASAQRDISAALINTTRLASQISAEDVAFHRSSNANVARLLDRQNARLLALAERLLRNAATNFRGALSDSESIDSHWTNVVDTVDNLLERSDICLDEYNGRFKNQMVEQRSDSSTTTRTRSMKNAMNYRAQNLLKPQLAFEHPPNNHASHPFRPLLSSKPHALVPYEESFTLHQNEYGIAQHQHPYQLEIDQYQYPSSLYTEAEPLPYTPFENTQATFIDDYEGVLRMLEELKGATEIAIDLEHHDTHSYTGIVSLMQISTRSQDWIVDTLKPWRRKLEVLNEVFTDPNILKVLHGAQMDIVWLQRDLGLYIVGLFDTHHASRALGYAGGSLAFLLKKFVDFDAQKQYQMADWRMRPIPPEMFDYARSDTHFLLYIYDNMRNELIQRSKFDVDGEDRVEDVLSKSKDTALQRYDYFVYEEDQGLGRSGWYNLLLKNTMVMSKAQFAVFRKVHEWRDSIGRQEDEGVNSIMPNHVLFNITRSLPRDVPSLLSVSQPVSQFVRLRCNDLVNLIGDTIATAEHGPDMRDKLNEIMQSHPLLTRKPTATTFRTVMELSQKDTAVHVSALGISDNDLRSTLSSFWGTTLKTSEQFSGTATIDKPISILPVPFLHYHSDPSALPTTRSNMDAAAASTPVATGVSQDGVLETAGGMNSQTGGKRKAAEALDGIQSSVSSPPLSTDAQNFATDQGGEMTMVDATASADKTAAKQARNLQKQKDREARNARSATEMASKKNESLQPFDYGSAPSVLHAATASRVPKEGKKQPVNPYAKASDAASGMKKAQEYRNGKSWTFKH